MSKLKYTHGEGIKSLDELIAWLNNKGSVYVRGKYYHPGWALSWNFRYVASCVRQGIIVKAIKIKENDDD
jgi:hypothetical protein